MASLQTYELVTTDLKRTKAELRDTTSSQPIFQLDLSFALKDYSRSSKGHSIVMRDIHSNVVGTADISFSSSSTPIHLCFGNGGTDALANIWEDLRCCDQWSTSVFELSIDLGEEVGRKTFYWKRTHDMDTGSVTTARLDSLHLKLVEAETEKVVARFAHHLLPGSKRGRFELLAYLGGSKWEVIVMLSGNAVLEYLRKSSGWSW